MFDPTTITLEEQIAEVRREVAIRERCYPTWVEKGSLKPAKAVAQLAILKAALATLCALQAQHGETPAQSVEHDCGLAARPR